ncbi:MAG: hypothetical protein LBS60_05460 [Deltaproteobacteria bacterium]|jgi:hypothetical protein|nr:hypothetical protein [Deltaproteobacteria bacterium]
MAMASVWLPLLTVTKAEAERGPDPDPETIRDIPEIKLSDWTVPVFHVAYLANPLAKRIAWVKGYGDPFGVTKVGILKVAKMLSLSLIRAEKVLARTDLTMKVRTMGGNNEDTETTAMIELEKAKECGDFLLNCLLGLNSEELLTAPIDSPIIKDPPNKRLLESKAKAQPKARVKSESSIKNSSELDSKKSRK